jgi:quercetin dioxygenase-like cupin family protein
MNQPQSEERRLRKHPAERFAPAVKEFDLADVHQTLVNEPHEGLDGHRQVALVKKQGVTLVYFAFEEGGKLPRHSTDGVVTIHALEGELVVDIPDGKYTLKSGQLLVIESGIEHAVYAREASRMLLTVSLDEHRLPSAAEH